MKGVKMGEVFFYFLMVKAIWKSYEKTGALEIVFGVNTCNCLANVYETYVFCLVSSPLYVGTNATTHPQGDENI